MKNKTFWDSIRCAFHGLFTALITEKNFKYYIAIALLFLVLNVVCKVSFAGHLGYLITAAGVFSAECINTSIEHFVDMQDGRIRPEIKLIKDIAAAAVLCWGFAFFGCEACSLAQRIISN